MSETCIYETARNMPTGRGSWALRKRVSELRKKLESGCAIDLIESQFGGAVPKYKQNTASH